MAGLPVFRDAWVGRPLPSPRTPQGAPLRFPLRLNVPLQSAAGHRERASPSRSRAAPRLSASTRASEMLRVFVLNYPLPWARRSPNLKHKWRAPDWHVNFAEASFPSPPPARSLRLPQSLVFPIEATSAARPAAGAASLCPRGAPVPSRPVPFPPSSAASRIRGSVPTDLRPRAGGGKEPAGCQHLDEGPRGGAGSSGLANSLLSPAGLLQGKGDKGEQEGDAGPELGQHMLRLLPLLLSTGAGEEGRVRRQTTRKRSTPPSCYLQLTGCN